MKISKHAVERFLERVKGVKKFSKEEYKKAYVELKNLFKDVITNKCFVVVPNYPKFVAVVKNGVVVTILEKFSMFYPYEKKTKRRKNGMVYL